MTDLFSSVRGLSQYNPIPKGCDLFLPIYNNGLHGPVYQSVDPFGHTVTRTNGTFDSDGHWRADGDDVQKVTYSTRFDYTTKFSIGGWFYIDPDDATNDGNIVGLISKADRVTASGGYYIAFEDRGGAGNVEAIKCVIADGVAVAVAASTSGTIPSAGWYLIFATYDNSIGGTEELQVFVGTPTTTISQNATADTALTIGINAYPVSIGANDDGAGGSKEYIDARFRLVWSYNRALSLSELVYMQRMTVGGLT